MYRVVWAVAFAVLAIGYYYVLGAGPTPSELSDRLPWWRPWGGAQRWPGLAEFAQLVESETALRAMPLLVYSLPPLVLGGVGLIWFRSAAARSLILAVTLMLGTFVYYGLLAERVWRFFGWRFLAVALSFCAVVSIVVFAPSLLRALARWPRWLGAGIVLGLAAGVFVLSTEVTGTNSAITFNISPWPVVTVFGFLLFGYWIGLMHVATGLGTALAERVAGRKRQVWGVGLALVGGALASFGVFTNPDIGKVSTTALGCGLYAYVVLRDSQTFALSRVAAGLLLVGIIGISNRAAVAYQVVARNETAQTVLVALERYRDAHGAYPEELKGLVPSYLSAIPRPAIGPFRDADDEFRYFYFGDSYALEFPSVQWVQCAYSPPYEADPDEEETDGIWDDFEDYAEDSGFETAPAQVSAPAGNMGDEAEMRESLRRAGLEGSWSCATEPPKLW